MGTSVEFQFLANSLPPSPHSALSLSHNESRLTIGGIPSPRQCYSPAIWQCDGVTIWNQGDRRRFSEGTRKGAVMPWREAHSSTASMMRSCTFTLGPSARAYRFSSYFPSGCR